MKPQGLSYRRARGIVAMLGALVLGGCAAHVEGLLVDEQFSHQSVVQGRLAIGGVVSVDGNLTGPLRNRYAGMFLREIRKERSTYPLISAGQVELKVGSEYPIALDDYRYINTLSAHNLGLFRNAVIGARYILFSRIEGTTVQESREDEEIIKQDDLGNIIEEYVQVTLTRTRRVTAVVNIFDLETGASVWSGELSQRRSNNNEYRIDKDERFEGALISAVINTLLFGDTGREYPDPPEFDEVLKAVFHGFAENFPEAE
ncbi:MAG: hypothetical protein AAF420_11535 [Pseudomonadota bacterium]